jgi:hypothetical protein
MSRAVDDHPVIKPRYRAASRLSKCRGNDPVQETRNGADKHSPAEGHCPPLMPEIRFADRARMIKEESINHVTDLE